MYRHCTHILANDPHRTVKRGIQGYDMISPGRISTIGRPHAIDPLGARGSDTGKKNFIFNKRTQENIDKYGGGKII